MRFRKIEAMLTELSTVPISTSQSRHKARKSITGTFVTINNTAKASRRGIKDKLPHFHPAILLESQYAARANSMYGVKVLNSV